MKFFNFKRITGELPITKIDVFKELVDFCVSRKYLERSFDISDDDFARLERLNSALVHAYYFTDEVQISYIFTELRKKIIKYLEQIIDEKDNLVDSRNLIMF